MMNIIIGVATGMRPSLQSLSDEWPGEAQQMVDLMKRCWDQDPKKRPCFSGSHLPGLPRVWDGRGQERKWSPRPL